MASDRLPLTAILVPCWIVSVGAVPLCSTLPDTSEAVFVAASAVIDKPALSVSPSPTVYVPTIVSPASVEDRFNSTVSPLSSVIVKLVPILMSFASDIVAVKVTTSPTPTNSALPTVDAVTLAIVGAVVSNIETSTVDVACASEALPKTSFRNPSETVRVSTFVPVPPKPESACSAVEPTSVPVSKVIVISLLVVLTVALATSDFASVRVTVEAVLTAFQVSFVKSRMSFTEPPSATPRVFSLAPASVSVPVVLS